jgi:hypothetical protein
LPQRRRRLHAAFRFDAVYLAGGVRFEPALH